MKAEAQLLLDVDKERAAWRDERLFLQRKISALEEALKTLGAAMPSIEEPKPAPPPPPAPKPAPKVEQPKPVVGPKTTARTKARH